MTRTLPPPLVFERTLADSEMFLESIFPPCIAYGEKEC
jgi:hypothetical protein